MTKPNCQILEYTQSDDLVQWLEKKAQDHKLTYLLAHADDGVIWGKFADELITSGDVFDQLAKLRLETLQQCRAFSEKAQVMLWKVNQGWSGYLITDDELKKDDDYIEEFQILWGTKPEVELKDFILVSDGSEGLKHAIPLTDIKFKPDEKPLYRPLRLVVRHYLDYDETGVARIYLSRLVNLLENQKISAKIELS